MNPATNEWHLGIGDPTLAAWLTVVHYLLAALIAWWASRRCQDAQARFWLLLSVLLLLLGINKQLDLQSLMTQEARALLRALDVYEDRRVYQAGFIAALGVGAVGAAVLLVRHFRREAFALKLAVVGLLFELGFVFARAASFHHLDMLLPRGMLGTNFNVVFENLGILLMLLAAGLRVLQTRRSPAWRRA